MPVYRGAGGAGDATNDATVTAVQTAATSAATSATNAANSATAAANSASGASTSATNASNSATTAAGSVATASTQATNAATSASTAATQAGIATTQATNAASSASAASTSATNASNSASAAATSATNAGTSATNSAASAASTLAIFGDATDVANAVTAAQLAETNAETAETNAETAATTATNAASTATTQATNASTSATNANASATAASIDANEAQAAATAAQAAVSSATAIYGSLEDIQQAEANSEANRDAAAASATSASNSASTATTQAGIATTQANNAATSAAAASAVALGNEPVRHSVRPSLLLDFANTKTLDPRITFTRASTGTLYDGKTVALAEQNLILQSENFSSATWQKVTINSVTANATVAPDGTTTADLITVTASTGTVYQINFPTGTLSLSCFVKAGTCTSLSLEVSSTTGRICAFDLSAGTAGAVSNVGAGTNVTGGTAAITDVGNGWYRCSISNLTVVSASASVGLVLNSAGNLSLWGAQLEQRSAISAYISAYTATTTATITNYIPVLQTAAAGVARFEHNPTTGESLGLEIEEQRTNLILRSEEIDNAYWTKTNSSITANAVVAPNGTLTADSLVENTSAAGHNISSTAFTSGLTSAISYTFSVYVKPAGRSWAILEMAGALGGGYGWFDLSTGTLGTQTQLSGTSTITAVGNGWYRISITDISTGTGSSVTKCNVYATTGNNVISYTGDGFSGISVWGAQLEAGAFATSYIPTVASQVTRSADSASMTGTNFSSWYRTDEGTVYAEVVPSVLAATSGVTINDNTTSNRIRVTTSSVTDQSLITASGTAQATLDGGTPVVNTSMKLATAYKVNDFALSLNAGTVATDASGIVPVVSQLQLGAETTTIGNLTVKKVAYYPKRLTNAELQGLTTV